MLVPDRGQNSARLLPVVVKKIVKSRIVPVLLDAILQDNADTDFRESVLGLVRNLALHPDAKKPIGHSSAALIATLQGCTEAEVKILACYALTNLATESKENQARISGDGVVIAILAAVRAHPRDAAVLVAAFSLMKELAVDDENIASQFVGEGGPDLLLSAMKGHPHDAMVQVAACGLLAYLPYEKRERVAPKLAKAIVLALEKHPRAAEVQIAACEALLEITTHVPAVRGIVKEKHTRKLLEKAKKGFEDCESDVDDLLVF